MFARSGEIHALHVDRADLAAIFQFDDPGIGLVAADRLGGLDRLREFQLRRFARFDEFEHQRGRADFQRRGDLAHVGVADDDVKPPVA